MIRFDVKFNISDQHFVVDANFDKDDHFDLSFGTIHEVTIQKDAEPYRGEYEVTPKLDAQVLPTAQKLMADDLTVKAIPYFETSNLFDGETVYIGTEVEIYGD